MAKYVSTLIVKIPFSFDKNLIDKGVGLEISSGLGGTFSLKYCGESDEKHLFQGTNKEFPRSYEFSKDELPNHVWMYAKMEFSEAKLLVEHKFDVGHPGLVAYVSSTGVRPEITQLESMPCKKDQLGLLANRFGKIVSFETAFG
jgi:hypothetical protein